MLAALVREAARRGYSQHAVLAGPQEDWAGLALPPEEMSFLPSPLEADPVSDLEAQRLILERVRADWPPDVVHVHHLGPGAALAREVFADVPVLVSCHDADVRRAPHRLAVALPALRRLDRIGVLTPRSRLDVLELSGIEEGRVAVTGAGYDAEVFEPAQRPLVEVRDDLERRLGIHLPPPADEPGGSLLVTFAGPLSVSQGAPFLIEAAMSTARQGETPPFRLVLVGEQEGKAGELIRRAGDLVLHLDPQPAPVLARLLQVSDLFVLPAVFEGMPLPMLEAAACGCPCLVSGLPSIRSWMPVEWVDNNWFRLIPPLVTVDADRLIEADIPRFVEAIARGLRRQLVRRPPPESRRELADRLREHSWARVFERYERLYQELCPQVSRFAG
ncbi:MAG TPA: glycosyltransferase family 4 protein [Thermoanaerobaculia bacterium]|nr:glycosyltransferase family 4 protein [Thermoanaerobaculia bacterium]